MSYRLIDNPELDRFHGAGVFYGAATSQASVITGQDVVVVGGGNSAGQAASFLAAHARRVTVLVRGGSLAESMSDYLIRTLQHASNIDIRYHSAASRIAASAEVVGASGERRLQGLTFLDTSTSSRGYLLGADHHEHRPLTDWLSEEIRRDPCGYVMTGDDTSDNAGSGTGHSRFETSIPGVYADPHPARCPAPTSSPRPAGSRWAAA